jgi:hypothetical protein
MSSWFAATSSHSSEYPAPGESSQEWERVVPTWTSIVVPLKALAGELAVVSLLPLRKMTKSGR